VEFPGGGDHEILVLGRRPHGRGLGMGNRTVCIIHREFSIIAAKNCCNHADAATHSCGAMDEHVADATASRHKRQAEAQSSRKFGFPDATVCNRHMEPFGRRANRAEQRFPVKWHRAERHDPSKRFLETGWVYRCFRSAERLLTGPIVAEVEAFADGPHEISIVKLSRKRGVCTGISTKACILPAV
jgi:hypothetical protein